MISLHNWVKVLRTQDSFWKHTGMLHNCCIGIWFVQILGLLSCHMYLSHIKADVENKHEKLNGKVFSVISIVSFLFLWFVWVVTESAPQMLEQHVGACAEG